MNSLEVDDISNGISNILSSVSKRGGRLDDDGAEVIVTVLRKGVLIFLQNIMFIGLYILKIHNYEM